MKHIVGNIFLVGLTGVGKTTIGKILARRLDKVFYDSDHEIEARTGVRIATIFDIEGERSFRKWEAAAIADLAQRQNIVLATGGGAILDANSRAQLIQHGVVVYLRGSIDDILKRIVVYKNRPLLQTPNPRAMLEMLLQQRDPLYREVANLILDTNQQNIDLLVNRCIELLAIPQVFRVATRQQADESPGA